MSEDNMQILIVDDTQSELLELKAILDNMGLKIVAVDSGSKALSCLLFQDFVAVLLDVDMPLMDGFETATLLRKQTRNLHLPIIFIVSEPILDSERIKGYQLGAVDYILTPIIPEILRSKVAVFCDLYRLQKQELVISQNLQDKNTLIEQQNLKLLESNEAINSINKNLESRVNDALIKIREKDHLMIHQSRLALMGEMIGNIAHQWRQPLNSLGLVLGNIQDANQHQQLTPEYLAHQIREGQRLIQKMSTTIRDFQDFFRPDKKSEYFQISRCIANSIELIKDSFTAHNITITVHISEELVALGSPNEYSQVLLNLFSNAKEAIFDKDPDHGGRIDVQLRRAGSEACVTISDSGGGICDSALQHLYEPYFTTKIRGGGIGLYMSKMIVENSMSGRISASNGEEGAQISVFTPLPPIGVLL